MKNIPEPACYEKVTRHAELGKRTSFESEISQTAPDLHVSCQKRNLSKK